MSIAEKIKVLIVDDQVTSRLLLSDALTQLETHEVDQATRSQSAAEEALSVVIEISTELEVQSFAARTTADRPKLERRMPTRQSSIAGASLAPRASRQAQPLVSPVTTRAKPSTNEMGEISGEAQRRRR